MTKAEIATYVGVANAMISSACKDQELNEDTGYLFVKTQEALMAAQLILTQQAINEATAAYSKDLN